MDDDQRRRLDKYRAMREKVRRNLEGEPPPERKPSPFREGEFVADHFEAPAVLPEGARVYNGRVWYPPIK